MVVGGTKKLLAMNISMNKVKTHPEKLSANKMLFVCVHLDPTPLKVLFERKLSISLQGELPQVLMFLIADQ